MKNKYVKGLFKSLALILSFCSLSFEVKSAVGFKIKYFGNIPVQQLKLLQVVGIEKDENSSTVLELREENGNQFKYVLPEKSPLNEIDKDEFAMGIEDIKNKLQNVIQDDEDGFMNVRDAVSKGLETYLNSEDKIKSIADVIHDSRNDSLNSQQYEKILEIFEDIYMGHFAVETDMYGFMSAEEVFNIVSNQVMVQDFAYSSGGGGTTIYVYGEKKTTWWLPDGTTGVDYEYSDTVESEVNRPDGSRTKQTSVRTENSDGSTTTTTTTTECDGNGNCTTTTTVQNCDQNNNCTTTTTSGITAESESGHGPYFVVLDEVEDFFSSQSGSIFKNEIMQYYLNQSSALNTQNRINLMFMNHVSYNGSQVRIGF